MRALEATGTVYFQTVYRLTIPTTFHVFLTGSFLTDDLLIVAVGIVSCVTVFYRKKHLLYAISGFYALMISLAFLLESTTISTSLSLSLFPAISVAYLLLKNRFALRAQFTKNQLILMTILIFLAIEVASLFTWIFYPAFPSPIYGGSHWYAADLEAKLFYSFGLLSPALITLTIFSYGIKPGIESIKDFVTRNPKQHSLSPTSPPEPLFQVTRRNTIVTLAASSALIVLLSVYPYLPSINEGFEVVSVDAPYYVNQINAISRGGLFSEDGPFSFANERLLSILVFYAISSALGQPAIYVIPFLPILLNLLLVFSVYYLVRYALGKEHPAVLIAPILTVFSTQFVVGVYGGFFSNMLALPLVATSFLFILRYFDSKAKIHLAILAATIFMTLLVHVYTWVFLTSTIIVALAINHFKDQGSSIRLLLPLALIIASSAGLLVGIGYLAADSSGLRFISGLASSSISEDYFATRWFSLNYVFRLYLGGFLTNSAVILLALVWALKADYRKMFNALILSSMFITSVFFLIGDEVIQSRMFYNILFLIPAGIVLAKIMTGSLLGSLEASSRLIMVSLVILHFANYAFRSVANFNLS